MEYLYNTIEIWKMVFYHCDKIYHFLTQENAATILMNLGLLLAAIYLFTVTGYLIPLILEYILFTTDAYLINGMILSSVITSPLLLSHLCLTPIYLCYDFLEIAIFLFKKNILGYDLDENSYFSYRQLQAIPNLSTHCNNKCAQGKRYSFYAMNQTLIDSLGIDDKDIPEHFKCPITMQVMDHPLKVYTLVNNQATEHTFESEAIELWIENHNDLNPLNRQVIVASDPNYVTLKEIYDFIKVHSQYVDDRGQSSLKSDVLKNPAHCQATLFGDPKDYARACTTDTPTAREAFVL